MGLGRVPHLQVEFSLVLVENIVVLVVVEKVSPEKVRLCLVVAENIVVLVVV